MCTAIDPRRDRRSIQYTVTCPFLCRYLPTNSISEEINLYRNKPILLGVVGDVELASSKEAVVAWWGSKTPTRGHILAEDQQVNAVV